MKYKWGQDEQMKKVFAIIQCSLEAGESTQNKQEVAIQ